ncbi:hypothetical protein COHA_007557 [Chlorella ohadii]|uniref:Calcineurin-like phosphoesterase domain-containing protein n=1 Tax=Chlorella ohadii TaxID=2649997 RepID=A0AAD5DLR9_9CHLO|nr:hypothetical protein COHA_007557 [Chlorella ohadii]
MSGSPAPDGSRSITILHLNDVYDICPRDTEPVGGAARMAARLRSFGSGALVLFSGDAFHPSLLSTGKQMVEVLNACNVKAACVGNHDFDGSVETFEELAAECNFPWLMANVIDLATGKPLGGARPTMLLQWGGIKLGLVGLVEQEWLTTLAAVDPSSVRYTDFVQEGRRLAAQLRAEGAEVVIALTHMRLPNDLRLAENVPGIDLVLGGHDHDYFLVHSQASRAELFSCLAMLPYAKHGTPVVKSGTDFREFTEIQLTVGPAEPAPAGAAGAAGAAAGDGGGAAAAYEQPCSPPATPRSLMVTAWQLPGRVADSVATLPDSMARLALRSHARCSKWARLAGIPALAGCNLSADAGDNGGGDSCGSPAAETPHCLQSPRGGGENATPEGHSAALVYEEAAAASLATSLIATRLAGSGSLDGAGDVGGSSKSAGSGSSGGGGSGAAPQLQLTFHCLRHVITAELPEDPEVVEIVQRYEKLMGERMDVVVGHSATDLDGRFST